MANQVQNPFEDDKPQIVHFEKDESHYEYCRMQMHDINRVHKRTFFCNMGLCIVVCMLAMFQQRIAGFDMLSTPFAVDNSPGMILAQGIFQIIFAMIIILIGYLAWANFHTLNLILAVWYGFVTAIGIYRLDYLSAIVGAVGIVFYFFSLRAMSAEGVLSRMEGYPDFQEKFDISKSDIVVQTLLAHKGEHRTKSTLFTTDYSLRRKKKKPAERPAAEEGAATDALAEELQKQIDAAKHSAEDAQEQAAAEPETPAAEEAHAEMTDIVPEPAEEAAPAEAPAAEPEAPAEAKPAAEASAPAEDKPKQPAAANQPRPAGSGSKKHKKRKKK